MGVGADGFHGIVELRIIIFCVWMVVVEEEGEGGGVGIGS